MRAIDVPAILTALALCPAVPAIAQEPATDDQAPGTVTLTGVARTLTLTGAAARPISGVEVRIEDTELSARSDAEGRFTVDEVPVGPRAVIIDALGFERGRLSIDVQPGAVYAQSLIEYGACPEGETCLVAADAVVEFTAQPAARAGEFVMQIVLPDGTTREAALPGPFDLPWSGTVQLGNIELNVRLYEEHGRLTTMWYADVTTPDGEVVSDGLVTHLEPGVMPGCSERCSAQRDLIREVRFARSSVGDPTALCEPQICP